MRAGEAPRGGAGGSAAAFWLALALSGTLAVCGVKAPPRPPLEEPPAQGDAGPAPAAGSASDAGTASDAGDAPEAAATDGGGG